MNTSLFANMSVRQIRQTADVKEKIEALQQDYQKQLSALEREFAQLIGEPEAVVPTVALPAAKAPAIVAPKSPAKAPMKASTPAAKVTEKSNISAAGRANIIAAQKARWAKIQAVKPVKSAKAARVAPTAKPVKLPSGAPKRNISPEGRARIIAGAKARWAKVRAAKAA